MMMMMMMMDERLSKFPKAPIRVFQPEQPIQSKEETRVVNNPENCPWGQIMRFSIFLAWAFYHCKMQPENAEMRIQQ